MAQVGLNLSSTVLRGFRGGKKFLPLVLHRKFSVVPPLVTRNDMFGKSAIDEAVENLERIPVSRSAIEKCRQAIQGKTVDTWNEKVQVMEQPMIRSDMIEKYLTYMQNNYPGVDNEWREKLEGIIFGPWKAYLDDLKHYRGDSKLEYGLINFGQSDDRAHYSCIYGWYSADVRFTEELTTKDHPILWGLINIKTFEIDKIPLAPEIIEAIHDFLRFRALDGFLKNGIIHRINFVA